MCEIEVFTKKGLRDMRGEHVLNDILQAGIDVKKVEYSPVYAIEGINKTQASLIGKELLSDKITESFTTERRGAKASVIKVWYKHGVTDAAGESVKKALRDLGIKNEVKVKTGHIYYISGAANKKVLEKIATSVLANTLIQEYEINEMR
jgi:phosphoribosylformylglycinamidine synthase